MSAVALWLSSSTSIFLAAKSPTSHQHEHDKLPLSSSELIYLLTYILILSSTIIKMADFIPPSGPPPPKVPEGWKAQWNDQYKEWYAQLTLHPPPSLARIYHNFQSISSQF